MSERRNPADERPIYRYVTRTRVLTGATIFQSENGEFWKEEGHDLKVFHPRAQYEQGRPTWLLMAGLRTSHVIDFMKLNIETQQEKLIGHEPLLVQAFIAGESADAVPVDQIIIYPEKQIPVLLLPSGKIHIRVIDKSAHILGQYTVSMK